MLSIPKTLNPTSAFKIIDSKGGYIIYSDAITNKGEADPEQEFIYKKLESGKLAHSSLHCAAWEGEMGCANGSIHKIPANIRGWLCDQI